MEWEEWEEPACPCSLYTHTHKNRHVPLLNSHPLVCWVIPQPILQTQQPQIRTQCALPNTVAVEIKLIL